MSENKKVLSIWPDLGEELGIGRTNAYRLSRKPGFPVLAFGNRKVIPRKALERWIEEQLKNGGVIWEGGENSG